MDAKTIAKLQPYLSEQEGLEIKIAFNGQQRALQSFNESPGDRSRKDIQAAKEYFQEVCTRLLNKYMPEQLYGDSLATERFRNRKQALGWLQGQGYKVSQGKFYQDCNNGFPTLHKDGSVSRFQVMEYGQRLDVTAKSAEALMAVERENEKRKAAAEAAIAEMKAEKMRREMDIHWLHADDAWAQVAALVGTLRDSIRHHLFGAQRELVEVAGGDQDRSQELYDFCDQVVSKAFNEVAGNEISVVFEREAI